MRSSPKRAALLAALTLGSTLAFVSSGCIEIVSLGSGVETDGAGGSETGKIKPGLLMPAKGLEEVTVGGALCSPGLTTDLDGDGFSVVEGDCNYCDPHVGPNWVEMATEDGDMPLDENCDGVTDEPPPTCDEDLLVGNGSARAAASAIDICQTATLERWGVVSAKWVLPDGSVAPPPPTSYDLGHGILSGFGPNVAVRHGKHLLALSSGTARQPTDPDYSGTAASTRGFNPSLPRAFPRSRLRAPESRPVRPTTASRLELTVKTPQNAEAFAFDFDFYTYEFPENICSSYNDLFVALLAGQRARPPRTSVSTARATR